MRAVRKALPAEARAQRSQAIVERLLALRAWKDAEVVAAFVAIRGEVDLSELRVRAHAAGKTVALPRVDYELGRIVLLAHAPGDPLEPGSLGVPEPTPSAPRIALSAVDLVVVPGLAFDPRGYRVGYGKGFYDQMLPTLTEALSCAVGFDFQLVSEVPDQPHDVPVDVLITDARHLAVSAKAEE